MKAEGRKCGGVKKGGQMEYDVHEQMSPSNLSLCTNQDILFLKGQG